MTSSLRARRSAVLAAATFTGLGALSLLAAPLAASAQTRTPADSPGGIASAVFVQSNATTGNQILAYSRSEGGTLSFVHAYDTGGKGARTAGSVVDPLASQGSLVYDPSGGLLIAVNAGSNTITSFRTNGDVLSHAQLLRAGQFPVSVTTHGSLVYVLDAGGTGTVRGYFESHGWLSPITGSGRNLGLNPSLTPQYLNTPGQVGFSPDGSQLIVTTKANGSDIDVFGVKTDGKLSATAVQNASAEPVPFGFVFDPHGRLVVTEAGGADVSTYGLDADGSVTLASTVVDGQEAPCWIASVGSYYYVANAGSADIAGYQVSPGGNASLIAANGGIAGTTDGGPIDLAGSSNGQFLYVEAGGAGAVDEFAVNSDGALTSLGSITGLSGTGIEGIVAS
jgi:6-phosphogluconolactonase (cycloisomerase 2 family)